MFPLSCFLFFNAHRKKYLASTSTRSCTRKCLYQEELVPENMKSVSWKVVRGECTCVGCLLSKRERVFSYLFFQLPLTVYPIDISGGLKRHIHAPQEKVSKTSSMHVPQAEISKSCSILVSSRFCNFQRERKWYEEVVCSLVSACKRLQYTKTNCKAAEPLGSPLGFRGSFKALPGLQLRANTNTRP